ncbi:MAG TPA: hypothetical protein VEW67_08460 [Thermoleophilaceae bacterium]|nr:hypothetical protein [Thermoleophilaceae bacterium]
MTSPPLPSEFFIFVNPTLPMTRHNFELTKTFTSRFAELLQTAEGQQKVDQFEVDPMPFKQNPDQYEFLSPFVVNLQKELWIEWEAERVRRDVAPQAPGRLSALYAFGDEATCREVAANYKWDLGSVRLFKINTNFKWRAVRVNMEVVSLMRSLYPRASWQTDDANMIWSHYWLGGEDLPLDIPSSQKLGERETFHSGVIWEWLIEGQVVCTDDAPVFP